MLHTITNQNHSDNTTGNVSLEKLNQPLDEVLVESTWVCPVIGEEHIPPDSHQSETRVNKVQLQYRLNLQLWEKQAAQAGIKTEIWTSHVPGLMEGNNWSHNSDGSWFIPAMDLPTEALPSVSASYNDTFQMDGIKVTKCAAPSVQPTEHPSSNTSTMVQSNTGANACITADLSILQEVQWIQPVGCESAKWGATIEIRAIGKYFIRGTSLSVNMYYCPDAHNTIISPTAMLKICGLSEVCQN